MESAAELHEARVLRGQIESKEAQLAALAGDAGGTLRAKYAEEIARLKSEYRDVLARQADRDYRRRRAEWRAQQDESKSGSRRSGRACA